ncbi:rho guanine nucleotide exchange factor 39-like [Bacillus rossius redtenbacheri]|uniref:rho guanine nucleotide exchange factor 39-like n=1 Tax=Bacillus rossius redtenbacheri TaxID=93214 RepID=UPI002FDDB829
MMDSVCHTPQKNLTLSAELRSVIHERNILTTRSRMKVLSALENITRVPLEEKRKQLRNRVVQELLTSEASYLHHLELIMQFFMIPLTEKPYISHAVYTALFGNMETLYKVNGELLNELKKNPDNVASAFLKLAPFFKLYSVYAFDYRQAITVLQDVQNSNPELSAFFANQESRPEVGTKLTALLITPIQRIPRYCLLLKEILAHTPASHPDYGVLQRSLHEVEQAARHINSLVHDYENMQKILELQRSLCGNQPCIVSPGRKFIKEGMLMKVSPHGKKAHPRYFVLFNDMLMYCKLLRSSPAEPGSLRCSCVLPLKQCRVVEILSQGMFKLTCHHEALLLYSASSQEGAAWIAALKDAVKQYHECRQTLRRDSSSKRPLRGQDVFDMGQDFINSQTKRRKMQSHVTVEEVFRDKENAVSENNVCLSTPKRQSGIQKKMRTLNCIQGESDEQPMDVSRSPESVQDSLYPLRRSVRDSGPRCIRRHAAVSGHSVAAESSPGTPESARTAAATPEQATWHIRGYQLFQYAVSSVSRSIRKHILRRPPSAPHFE